MRDIDRLESYLKDHQVEPDLEDMIRFAIEMARQAHRDPLTGVANRTALKTIWPDIWWKHTLTLAIIDIDHFKGINDQFGHGAGDLALIHFTHRMAMLNGDTYRIGGDEFVFVTPGPIEVVDMMLRPVAAGVHVPIDDDNTLDVTSSIGLCQALSPNLSAVMACADAALYRAKLSGRGRTYASCRKVHDHLLRFERPVTRQRDRHGKDQGDTAQ